MPLPDFRHGTGSPRVLVCYYSMTGNTRRLAQEVQQALGAQVEELGEPRPRHGLTGVVRALFDAITRRLPRLTPPREDPARFDLLVLGGPVWAGRMAAPVRSYAASQARRAHRLALFCTEGAKGADMAFADVEALCGRERIASLVVDAAHLDAAAHADRLGDFVEAVRRVLPVASAAAPAARQRAAG